VSAAVRRRLVLLASFLFSQAVVLLILRMPAVPGEGSWLKAFRNYFSFDQLSYAGIASTTAAGVGGLPEPFTETGQSYYPSLWYRILGWLSSLTGASVPTVWTIAGWAILAAAVAVVGWVGYRISRQAWAPALVGPALTIGTLSIVTHDYWYLTLESHATLWGPFGSLYVLNAEVAGAALVAMALALGLRVVAGPALSRRATVGVLVLAAAMLGVVANIQTYTFFAGISIALAWLAAIGLMRSRSRALLIATAVLVAGTLLLGSRVAGVVGGLATFGLLVLCTLPGIWPMARAQWRLLAGPAVVLVVVALPQALVVARGILDKDPFLTYRQDTSQQLGVPWWAALISSAPVIAIWLFALLAQRGEGERALPVRAALAALAFASLMLTFNDWWGFAQEPYRLWLATMTQSLLLLAPIVALSIARLRERPAQASRSPWLAGVAGVAIVLVGLSVLDFGAFRAYVKDSGVIRFDAARYAAMATLTEQTTGLISGGPCVDQQELKIATRKPVAYYNEGIAWPTNKAAIDAVVSAWRSNVFSPDALRAAQVRYLVTDSSCGTQWPVEGSMGISKAGSLDYADDAGSGTLTLWRILT
jgi:hypothetical protein